MPEKQNIHITKQEWNFTPQPSHNGDSQLIKLVRFLARRAAEADFEAAQSQQDIQTIKGD